MDDDHIKNFVTEVQEIRSVLLAAKEDLDEEGISSQERERSIKLADFIMKKVDNASTRVRDIFHKTFDYDKDELSAKEEEALTIELEKLYKSLVSADRKEMQVLHDQFKLIYFRNSVEIHNHTWDDMLRIVMCCIVFVSVWSTAEATAPKASPGWF
ncbi:hypothetical protein Y032_0006g2783 [Ancylostoma ceylanicum]|nr:hypothetical protein Y032_0006g2783 [Ancylostoma ceylanicum]